MIKKILTYPENKDALTSVSIKTTAEESKQLIQDLKDTLHNTQNGVGISAVQIGELKRVCVIHYNGQDIVMINPVITRKRGEINSQEGCLSVPKKFGVFKRAQKVWCTYINENGENKEIEGGGLLSRIIQHECEHMDGWCEVLSLIKEEE